MKASYFETVENSLVQACAESCVAFKVWEELLGEMSGTTS